MHVEIIVQVGLDEIVYKRPDGRTYVVASGAVFVLHLLIPHICRSELCLCLVGEDRLLNLYAYGSDDALTDVFRSEILLRPHLEELLEGL